MPIDDTGIYRAVKHSKILKKRQLVKVPNKGTIANWAPVKREAFERELISRRKPIHQIASEYGVCTNTAGLWKKRVLLPAIRAAEQQADIDEQKKAQGYLNWLYEEGKDSIMSVKYGKLVFNAEGDPIIDPDTGQQKRDFGDPKTHGTVAQLLGQTANIVKSIGEVSGEFKAPDEDARMPRIIKIITIPKIGETMPQFALGIGRPLPPAHDIPDDAIDVSPEA